MNTTYQQREHSFRAALIERVRQGATRDEMVNTDLAFDFKGQRVREFMDWADWWEAVAAASE